MKLVNDGIPDAIYRALCNDRYDPGDSDYTPSSLIAPAYQRRLIHEVPKDTSVPVEQTPPAEDKPTF